MDKALMKLMAKAIKVPQGDYVVFEADEIHQDMPAVLTKVGRKLGYPAFVKPAIGGSSIGITKVESRKELSDAILHGLAYCHKIVIEKAIPGREIEVGILGAGIHTRASVVGEIRSAEASAFYDFDAKYNNPTSQTVVPADISPEIEKKIQDYAIQIFRHLGGRGLSRVDFFVTDEGKIFFNEINTVPGFTSISMYAQMWEKSGVSRQELMDTLINIALDTTLDSTLETPHAR